MSATFMLTMLMCCHDSYDVLPPAFVPVQCGAELNAALAGALPDNLGDNISAKNREYCELTAHYYAWKNIESDCYGFCHYRRFFCFDESVKTPYLALGILSSKQQLRYFADEEKLKALCRQYDIILPRAEDMNISAREYYNSSEHHYPEDLSLFVEIMSEKAPHLVPFAQKYLSQNKQYFCNMFIMKKEYFYEYCEMLFPLLEEFDKRKTLHGDFQSDRTDGYLGELFTGIFVLYAKNKGAKVKEISRLDAYCSLKKRIVFRLFPPESKIRYVIKNIVRKG